MTISKTEENGTITLTIEGRVDIKTATQLEEELIPVISEGKKVVLNMSKMAYISSAGLRVLLLGQRATIQSGASMILCNVSAEVMEVFDMTGFAALLTIE